MKTDWPSISEYAATVGRLATAEDIHEGRAAFLLHSDGVRIGHPIEMTLPAFAWYVDRETDERQQCVLLQAEEADGKRYFGAELLEEDNLVVGFDTDFELVENVENQ